MALAVEFELGICSERCLPKNVGFLFAEAEVLPRLGSARVRWSIYVVSTVESELGIRFEWCINVPWPPLEDTSPSDEKVDQRSGQSCRVTRPRKRPCTHGRPHQGDSSSYVVGRPQHLALEEGPMSQDRLPNLFPSRVTDEAVLPTPTVVTMP
ncbi:hypothetical protein BHE74_00042402 [Ensete ventricosum]|nr:hypothetical protein GW17_00032007 [Ensete ventricosum]RWW51268.1 hypothetical protein BHE74_00042402 [Ensete ventricosum]